MSTILNAENISWRRDGKLVLKDVTWSVRAGEHCAILGLNGSGKTTLLNIITGYSWPTTGKISVLDKPFGTVDLRELRKSIGWVSSSLQERLNPSDMSESIVLSGKFASIGVYETPTEEDIDHARALMMQLGVSHLISRPYQTCSQGEKQKLAIARALMPKPKLLILDEPCNGLDVFSREQFMQSIEALAKEPDTPTLIYVTHHIDEITSIFEQTLLIRAGEVYREGRTKDILTSNVLSDFFEFPVEVEWRYGRAWLKVIS